MCNIRRKPEMAEFQIGDKVRIKERTDWVSPLGRTLVNAEGSVVQWVDWQEKMADFQDYVYVCIEKAKTPEYIGNALFFRAEYLEKI
jgi:hypothetical protein